MWLHGQLYTCVGTSVGCSPGQLPAAGTHLEFLVEFAAVSIQHGQVERPKVCVETGDMGHIS